MTIASTTNRVTYTGNGATVNFAVAFPFFAQADLVVIETIIATGVQTTKALTTDYTITGTPDALGHYSNGGTVVANTAPASTMTWTIYRDPSPLQSTDLVNNDSLPAESVESAFDFQTMLVQRTRDLVSRAVRQPEGDSANIDYLPSKVDRASKYLAFDADGDPIATAGTTEANPVSPFMATVLDDTTAAAARTTLGVSEMADTEFRVVGSSDATKKIAFEVDGVTAGQTRTMTVPNYSARLGNLPAGIGPLPYAGSSIPTGWLECDGSAVSRTTYADLFAAISTTWGTGDGSTTFNLPDMRGKTPIGAGTGTTAETVTASSSNGFTVAANNTKWITGMPVVWSALSGFTTSGSAGPTYYVVRISSTNIRFASTLALAQAASPDITISGSGSCTITYTMTARTLGEYGGEQSHAMALTELLAHTHDTVAVPTGGGTAAGGNPITTTGSTGSTGGNAAANIMQPFAVTKYIISY